MKLDDQTEANIESWQKGDYDAASKEAINKMSAEELTDAFYQHLAFGTGGLRGIMGVGTNRMNVYTVRAATQGLATYINKHATLKSVVIGYDSRHHSREFAMEAARVLAANKIEVFLYKELRPVPLVSFGVLYKKATAGIMITASHNPPEYNGYKVYWSHGGQVLPPHDSGIIEEVNRVKKVERVESSPLIHEIDGEIDAAYIKTVSKLALHRGDSETHGKELSIVYTSLHGAGITMVPKVLHEWGFTQITPVEKQVIPDGDFPTVKKPNPEEKAALSLGVETLKKVKGDLLIANDPDSDRIGIVSLEDGNPVYFTGNEVACMVLEHICTSLETSKQMPPKPMFIKTIVTTELFALIADAYGASCLDVLTGFKYIGEKISQWEDERDELATKHHYIFGGEESYGYLYGTHVRDKDGVIMAAVIAEMALQLKLQKRTLSSFLFDIYQKYGVHANKSTSFEFDGKAGVDKMNQMMQKLRQNPPHQINSKQVVLIEDYELRKKLLLPSGKSEPLLLPKSNVIVLHLDDDSKLVVRPSGTEPKIKFYCEVIDSHSHTDHKSVQKSLEMCNQLIDKLINELHNYCSQN